MITGDSTYIKKMNRGHILREIIKHEAISRADLAKITGLNKATISVQVNGLLQEKLITESKQEHHSVGRRPISLSINDKAGYVLGIDLDYQRIDYSVTSFNGKPVETTYSLPKTENYDEIIQHMLQKIHMFQEKYKESHYGLVGVTIGIHGTVNKNEQVVFVPTYHWRNKNMKEDLQKKIDLPIQIENNANLSAFAEKVYQFHETNHLLAINFTSGIGAGIMIHGEIYQGDTGFAGEIGHMTIIHNGARCRCGNKGCWELYASEANVRKRMAKRLQKKDLTRADIQQLIKQQNPIIKEELQSFIDHLSIGLTNVINIFNPETLVLTSNLLSDDPQAIRKIKELIHSYVSDYRNIVISKLGKQSCVLGASALMIQQFMQISHLMIPTEANEKL